MPRAWVPLVLLSPAAVIQNGFLTAALILFATAATLRGAPGRAGAAWAALAFKPYLGIAVLPFLLGQRRFGAILAGALGLAALIGATALAYGVESWTGFLTVTSAQQREAAETWSGVMLYMMSTAFIGMRLSGFEQAWAHAFQGAVTTLSALLLIRAWPGRSARVRDAVLWLTVATALLLPYLFLYDLMVLHAALVLWARDQGRCSARGPARRRGPAGQWPGPCRSSRRSVPSVSASTSRRPC